jgi:hypothetical protein
VTTHTEAGMNTPAGVTNRRMAMRTASDTLSFI